MEILLKDGIRYLRHNFSIESEFEKIVLSQHRHIFGERSLVFDKQKIRTMTGIGTIPDAFIIRPDKLKWYIVEVELASHSVYEHVIPQISKFKNALDNVNTRKLLTKYFDSDIENDLHKYAHWVSATSNKSTYKQLSEIVDDEPELLIIIDGRNEELELASRNLPFSTKVKVFKTFCREGSGFGANIYQFDDFELGGTSPHTGPASLANDTPLLTQIGPGTSPWKSPSPSAIDWVRDIPELANVNGLYKWSDICNHLRIKHDGQSARFVLEQWVRKNKANWKPVPKP